MAKRGRSGGERDEGWGEKGKGESKRRVADVGSELEGESGFERVRRRHEEEEAEQEGSKGERRKRKPREKEPGEATWRPFAESPVLASHRAAAGEAAPSSLVGERKGEKEKSGGKGEAAAAKPEAVRPAPKRKPRGPRPKQEVHETEEERREREREEKVAAIYKNLKSSGKTYGDVLTYMREYRAYPRGARVEAAKTLLEDIAAGKITPEIIEKLKTGKFDEGVALGHEKRLRRPRRRRGEGPREGVFYKKTGKTVFPGFDKLEEGTTEETVGEHGEKIASYHEGARWSWDEWYNFLLKQYATRPEFAKKKIEDYLEKHKEDHKKYSTEAFEAYERLFDELLAEKEGRELGEKFKEREEKAEGRGKRKLSEKDIDEIVLGFREYLENLSAPEGKTILERLHEVQMGEFESMLGENISVEDIDKRAAEIAEKEKIKPEDVRARAENELIAEAAKKFFALQELIVHHQGGWDPKRGFCMGSYSDLDGRGAVALFAKAGIDVKKGSYVPPGYRRLGAMNLDTSMTDGMFTGSEEKIDPETGEKIIVQTAYQDHHGIWSDRNTSATKQMFETFSKWDLLKFESEEERRAWEKAVEFVTQDDNYTFPGIKGGEFYKTSEGLVNGKKVYETSDRRLVGYAHGMPFYDVLQFFIDQEKKPAHLRKTPVDELDDRELSGYGIYKKRVAKRGEKVKKDLETVEKLVKDGWVVTAQNGKRLVVDIGDKMGRDGQWAAGSRGFDGILRYNPENHSFTIALNEGTFDEPTQEFLKSLPQGILIRGSFFYKPPAEKAKIGSEEEMSDRTKETFERVKGELLVTLGDLIEGVVDPKKKDELGKDLKGVLDKERSEGKLIKTNIFKIEEREIRSEREVKGVGKVILANWWAKTPDGTPILMEKVPGDFVSGEEGLVRLKDKEKIILRGENIEKFGLEWSGNKKEEKEADLWFGEWQKTAFPEPTPEERKIKEIERKIAESIGEEIEALRKKLYKDPAYSDVSTEVIERYLKEFGEDLWQRLVKTPSK